MSVRWDVRLEGGPFDGDKGEAKFDGTELPERLWVMPCKSCGTHWFSEWVRGGEVYNRKEVDEGARNAKYVWATCDTEPMIEEELAKLLDVPVPA